MEKRLEVIKKEEKRKCWACDGKGEHCLVCNGTGENIEDCYVFIDKKKNIAFDGDEAGK